MPSVDESVLRELHRAAVLAGRPGISVLSMDATRADLASGSRASTAQAVSRLTGDRRVERVRRDLLVLADSTGRIAATLPELVDVVAAPHYVITGGRALQQHDLARRPCRQISAISR